MSLQARFRRSINRLAEPLGFSVERFQPETSHRVMHSASIRDLQFERYLEELAASLAPVNMTIEAIDSSDFDEFVECISKCPISQARGGSGFNSALLLWTMTRLLSPTLIIESGVFRGFSSWVLREASPNASQFAFDISFANLRHRHQGVKYFERDWTSYSFGQPKQALLFFDDHIDQWKRIRESYERGFRDLIFDDNLPAVALHNDGEAAFPTVDMLYDTSLKDSEVIEWETECGKFSYQFDSKLAAETRELVQSTTRLPDLRYVFGYSSANLTYVKLLD